MDSDPKKFNWQDKLKALFNAHLANPEFGAPLVKDDSELKAPWPPGIDFRFVEHPIYGNIMQLRDGALLPAKAMDWLRKQAAMRFPRTYSLN